MQFTDRVIVVTGASSGIGRQAAVDFANNGAKAVVLVARSGQRLSQLVDEIVKKAKNCVVLPYICDISKKEWVEKMGRDILTQFGRIDILVNNAGFGIFGSVNDQSIDDIELVIATNYLGMVYCTKAFLSSMLENKSGHIVNVASLAASFGVAGMAGYCGSKFAMLGFSESLHHELHNTGVRVTVVSPIAVRTEFFNNKSFIGTDPNYIGFALKAKDVSKAILAAADSQRLEIVVPFYMRAAVWFKHTLPFIVQPLSGEMFRRRL